MLKRPNPYRKTRAAGTLDDLMFDMDKRRHTSFRFQNYQNFITDRPGKFDERYRQKLSWCALDEETGKLDYLTDGQSPNGGRRMSTSSVGSRTGDRDSLLPGQESCSSLLGGVPDDDALSSSTHEDSVGGSGGALSPTRRKSPLPPGFSSPPTMAAGGETTPSKPVSGRSWVAPQFAMDSDNRGTPSVLLEDSPTRDGESPDASPPREDDGSLIRDDGVNELSRSAFPTPSRSMLHTLGLSPPRRSTSSSGRRSSTSACLGLGTASARRAGSWARSNGSNTSSSNGSKVSGGDLTAGAMGASGGSGKNEAGGARGSGGDVVMLRTVKDDNRDGSDDGEDAVAADSSGMEAAGVQGGRGEEDDEGNDGRGLMPPPASTFRSGASEGLGVGGEAAFASGASGASGKVGREASYGTISQAFMSGTASTDTRGSLDKSFPRKSEMSNYFSSNASTSGFAHEEASLSALLGLAQDALDEATDDVTKMGHKKEVTRELEGVGSSEEGEALLVPAADDPALLVRPPVVGDGKLEHDKERRLGVADDLEAVIAELSRRKSLLAWEDGEGVPSSSSLVDEASPADDAVESGTGGREETETNGPQEQETKTNIPKGRSSDEELDLHDQEDLTALTATEEQSEPAPSVMEPSKTSPCDSDDDREPQALPASSASLSSADAAISPATSPIPGTTASTTETAASPVAAAVSEEDAAKDATPAPNGMLPPAPPQLAAKESTTSSTKAEWGSAKGVDLAAEKATTAPSSTTATSKEREGTAARQHHYPDQRVEKEKGAKSFASPSAFGSPTLSTSSPRGGKPRSARPTTTAAGAVAAAAASKARGKSGSPRVTGGLGYRAPTKSSSARTTTSGAKDAGDGDAKSCGGDNVSVPVPQQTNGKVAEISGKERAGRGREKSVRERRTDGGGGRGASAPPPPREKREDVSAKSTTETFSGIVTPSDLETSIKEQTAGAPPLSGAPISVSDAGSILRSAGNGKKPPRVAASSSAAAAAAAARKSVLRRSVSADVTHMLDARIMDETHERADAALTLSGIRTMPAQSGSATDDEKATTRLGDRKRGGGVANRRSAAASATASSPCGRRAGIEQAATIGDGTDTRRKGKYQVKDSFNRLRGWINGGFAGGNGRKNNGAATVLSPKGGSGGGTGGRTSTATTSCSSTLAKGVDSKNLTPSAAVDRAAARVEAKKAADREASKAAARESGSIKSPVKAVSRPSARRTQAPANAKGARDRTTATPATDTAAAAAAAAAPAAPSPSVLSTAMKDGALEGRETGGQGALTESVGESVAAVAAPEVERGRSKMRPMQAACAGSSPSPSRSSQSTKNSEMNWEAAKAAAAAKAGGVATGAGSAGTVGDGVVPRKYKTSASAAATAAAAIALSPASGRISVVAPAMSSGFGPSRVKTAKAAKSLGTRIRPLSPASRSGGGGGGGGGGIGGGAASGGRKGTAAKSKSPRTGDAAAHHANASTSVEPSPAPTRSPRIGKSGSRSPGVGGSDAKFSAAGVSSSAAGRLAKAKNASQGGGAGGGESRGRT